MIIGICGLIGSGKGTVADHLVDRYGFQKISFADALKDATAQMFEWPRELLEGDTEESRKWRETPDDFWSSELGYTVTPRFVLQKFGTECMRVGFYDGVWVSIVKRKILNNPAVNWVIPDTRFPNEIKMINSINGQVWRVKRGEDPAWMQRYVQYGIEPVDIHSSEWSWAKESFNQVIDNDSDLKTLYKKVKEILN